jgi:hypothetical protein
VGERRVLVVGDVAFDVMVLLRAGVASTLGVLAPSKGCRVRRVSRENTPRLASHWK